MLTSKQDAYGRMIYDHHRGHDVIEIVERDDGWISDSGGPKSYFAPFQSWPKHHREAMRFVRGHVLDIGCGAGRVSLHVQRGGSTFLLWTSRPSPSAPLGCAGCARRECGP